MDFVVRVERLPSPGETLLGSGFQTIPGGKGANQACALGRLSRSSRARMAGRVGYDLFGDQLKASLAASGVDVSFVHATRPAPTGVALIWVDSGGQNSIVVAPGANHALTPADVEGMRGAFSGAGYALFQLETPLPAVARALAIAREEGARTILDPAPAQSLSEEILSGTDILTPNEAEAYVLLDRPPARITLAEAPEIAQALLDRGPGAVILKLGDLGCYYHAADCALHVPAFPVHAVDTTAAGDTFNGALAVALAEDQPMDQALRFANAAAALSVTAAGAQASIPTRESVDRFLVT